MASKIYTFSDFQPGGRLYRGQDILVATREENGRAMMSGSEAIQALQEIGRINQDMTDRIAQLSLRLDRSFHNQIPRSREMGSEKIAQIFLGALFLFLAALGIYTLST